MVCEADCGMSTVLDALRVARTARPLVSAVRRLGVRSRGRKSGVAERHSEFRIRTRRLAALATRPSETAPRRLRARGGGCRLEVGAWS